MALNEATSYLCSFIFNEPKASFCFDEAPYAGANY